MHGSQGKGNVGTQFCKTATRLGAEKKGGISIKIPNESGAQEWWRYDSLVRKSGIFCMENNLL